jgi:hypothetical protein
MESMSNEDDMDVSNCETESGEESIVVDLGGRRSTLQPKEKAWLESQVPGYLTAREQGRPELLRYTAGVRTKWIKAWAKSEVKTDAEKEAKKVCLHSILTLRTRP